MKWDLSIAKKFVNQLDFTKANGLIGVITQDWKTNEVLMCAFANQEAIIKTLTTGFVHYYSRSRGVLWKKGETSGHVQEIKEVFVDCDNDMILIKVSQVVAACHTGYKNCFYRKLSDMGKLENIGERVFNPKEVY